MKAIATDLLSKNYADHHAIFFIDEGLVVDSHTSSPIVPFAKIVNHLELTLRHVYLDDSLLIVTCQSALTPDQMLKKGFHIHDPKSFLALTSEEEIRRCILRSVHWLTWNEKLQYCSKCGNEIQRVFDATEKTCGSCNLSFFPKLSPAVMVLIHRENEILLARSAYFKPGMYAAIAGFIDIGETAEQAAHREVKEEVGLEITELEYFGTQSWPFPDSFMIAFKAKYLCGEISIDTNEIEDARWFNLNNLPELPPSSSISRRLIESYLTLS
jgi:NAD+ diphosphatase